MLPNVTIVGRPNVGKSSLLNMLAGRRVSIVDPTAGVTRDRVQFDVELPPMNRTDPPRWCQIVDTGGYGVYSGDDELCVLTEDIESQITNAMMDADLILFVVDAMAGIAPLDEQVAQLLRERIGKTTPILLVANKVDDEKYVADAMEACTLGFGEPICISATTGRNKWELIETIAQTIDWDTAQAQDEPASEMLLAIVGKRNAGKSTLVNTLAGSQRVIASEMPGTTRDSVDVRFKIDEHTFTAIDTAGVRKRKSLADDVEYYSYHRALRSIRRADVVLLLIDATVPISQVDKKLAGEIAKHYKPCVIVLNKWDMVESELDAEDFLDYINQEFRGLGYAPIVCISATRGDGARDAVMLACNLFEQAQARVSTGKLNTVMKQILEKRGPSSRFGNRAKIFYVTQVDVCPPTIVVFVNDPDMFDNRYQRYIINQFRELLPFEEVPIKLNIRKRSRKGDNDQPVAES